MGRRYQKAKKEGPEGGGAAGLTPPAKGDPLPLSPAARRSPSAGSVKASPNKGKGKAKRAESSPAADEFGPEGQPAPPLGCEADPAVEDDLACTKCQSKDDDDAMMLCDSCDAAWHLYCLTPKLKVVPEGVCAQPALNRLPGGRPQAVFLILQVCLPARTTTLNAPVLI